MPLPFIIGIGMTTLLVKTANDVSDIKNYLRYAKEDAEEGNRYLEEAEQYREEVIEYGKTIYSNLANAKGGGSQCIVKNFKFFRKIDLTNDKYHKLRQKIKQDINKYHLNITLDDVVKLNQNIKKISTQTEVSLDKHNVDDMDSGDDVVDPKTILVGAGLGALFAGEFLTSLVTGAGALVVAPFLISKLNNKVDDASAKWEEAQRFKENACLELEKWKGFSENIENLYSISQFYNKTMFSFIDISNKLTNKYRQNTSLGLLKKIFKKYNDKQVVELASKNILILTYMSIFVQKEFGTGDGDLDQLFEWLKYNTQKELDSFREIGKKIQSIEEGV